MKASCSTHDWLKVPATHSVVRGHVATAVQALRARLAEPWTLSSLAAEVHLSRSQLVRTFAATVGMSPMVYLRQMRVERMAGVARAVPWAGVSVVSRRR